MVNNDGVELINIDNQNFNNTNNNRYLTDGLDDTSNMVTSYGQQDQMIIINGKLYAPIHQSTIFNGRNAIKQVNDNGYQTPTSLMSQQTKDQLNKEYDNTPQTPGNYSHLQEKVNSKGKSTPKRRNEQLNRSNEQKKKAKKDDINQHQYQLTRNEQSQRGKTFGKYTTDLIGTAANELNYNKVQLNIPIDQLKRAVGCNLPCFIIQFDSTIAPRDLPSAIIASDMIKSHFMENDIHIGGFSVASFAGHRLKLGVNNMEDYALLARTDKWPTTVNKKKIDVIKPKFVPECFTLVIRYAPHEVPMETIMDEIKRSISSADNFRQIKYSFNRPTKDIRFTVADLNEYEGALKLGHLAIVNRLYPITKYLPANKLTFCTNCWKVGHLRNSCKSNMRKCRVCLEVFNQEHISRCSGQQRCAQCGLDHHSLDPKCEVIQQYRQSLNQEVKQAVGNGTINRKSIPVHQQQQINIPRMNEEEDFPLFGNKNMEFLSSENRAWPNNKHQTTSSINSITSSSLTNVLIKMNNDFKKELKNLKNMIEKKIYEQININSSNIQLHQVGICTINSTIIKMVNELLVPLVNLIPDEHHTMKHQLSSVLQDIGRTCKVQSEHTRMSFNIGQKADKRSNNINNSEQSPHISSVSDSPTLGGKSDQIEGME